MANHKATKKSIIRIKKNNLHNRSIKSKIHTFIKKLEETIAKKDKDNANAALREVQIQIMKAVSKNVLKLNTASRRLSRLNSKVKAL